jgi:hypothetical protein
VPGRPDLCVVAVQRRKSRGRRIGWIFRLAVASRVPAKSSLALHDRLQRPAGAAGVGAQGCGNAGRIRRPREIASMASSQSRTPSGPYGPAVGTSGPIAAMVFTGLAHERVAAKRSRVPAAISQLVKSNPAASGAPRPVTEG